MPNAQKQQNTNAVSVAEDSAEAVPQPHPNPKPSKLTQCAGRTHNLRKPPRPKERKHPMQVELQNFLNELLPTLTDKAKSERLPAPVTVEVFDDIHRAGRHVSFILDAGQASKWMWAETPQPVEFPLRVVMIGADGEKATGFLRERGGWRAA
jgi:hypothetical protein